MRLLLVTLEPGWAEALRACFAPADIVLPAEPRQIAQNPALVAACDACFVAEASLSQWSVDGLKQVATVTDAPVFALTDNLRPQWEEAAFCAGAQQIFRRPLRGTMLQLAISRAQRRSVDPAPASWSARPAMPAPVAPTAEAPATLTLWRDFSRLLGQSGQRAVLLDSYVRQLRDVLRCSRLVLYVVDSSGPDRLLRCAYASGVDAREFERFVLTTRSGIGQIAAEQGTVVSRQRLRPDSFREASAQRELQVFGAELGVPVVGRDGLAGLLFVGARISGAEYSDDEIALLYHAVEAIGPLLTDQTSAVEREGDARRESRLLQALPIGAAIVNRHLRIVDANSLFRSMLGRTEACSVVFDDLPPAWSAAISGAVQTQAAESGAEIEHRTLGAPRKLRISVKRLGEETSDEFLVTVDDTLTPALAAQEADAQNIHVLLQRAGEQLSNEFRNALTPVDIMVQLSRESSTSRAELERLGFQVAAAIHRLRRRIDDLAYLTKSAIITDPTTVSQVLRFTRERLDDWLDDRHLKRVVWLNEFSEVPLTADSRALALAIAELVMNAVEACDGRPVTVTAEDSGEVVSFRIRNSGTWAPPAESSGFRHRPFVSSKSTGVGLGVEVASRVAENHGGRLVLGPVSADAIEAILRIPRHGPTASVENHALEIRTTSTTDIVRS